MKLGWKNIILILAAVLVCLVFLPSTILLMSGMIPTFVAFIVDRTKEQLKFLTVGCMNLAFCFPFWLDLVTSTHDVARALQILSPKSLLTMYMGAALGYVIEWVFVFIYIHISHQKNKMRFKALTKHRSALEEKWGGGVIAGKRLSDLEGEKSFDSNASL